MIAGWQRGAAMSALAGVVSAALAAVATPSVAPVVTATVKGHPGGSIEINGLITFSPATVKRGRIVFKIRNTDTDAHQFSVNGVDSRWIQPHGTGTVTVTFKRPGRYSATCPDADGAISGLLKVT